MEKRLDSRKLVVKVVIIVSVEAFVGLIKPHALSGSLRHVYLGGCKTHALGSALRLYKALIDPFDERDARKCARDDWHADRDGKACRRVDHREASRPTAAIGTMSIRLAP